MSAKLIVTAFGVILIILVNWYFFFSKRKAKAVRENESGIEKMQNRRTM